MITVAARAAQPAAAILASFVQQVGFEPPRIVFAIHKRRSIADRLNGGDACVVNICAAEDRALLKRFAGGMPPAADAFAGLAHELHAEGAVLTDAAACLICGIVARFDSGDHWLCLADVRDGAVFGDRQPFVHVRRNGLSY